MKNMLLKFSSTGKWPGMDVQVCIQKNNPDSNSDTSVMLTHQDGFDKIEIKLKIIHNYTS